MKNILFTLTKDFVLIPCEANKVYELENNVSKLIIKTPNLLDGFVYKLHKEQFNSKSFVVLEKTAEGLELLLDNGFLNKNGIYRVQLSANSDDKQIISNSVQLTVGRFINATEEPTPEQETAIDRLLVKAEVLAEAAADLNTLAVRTIANGIAVDYKGETFEVHNGNDGKDGENGKDGAQGPKGEDGAQGPVGPAGVPGVPGFSPSARVYRVSDGAVIEVTDEYGTTSAKVSDGKGSEGGASYYKLVYENESLRDEKGGRVYSSDVSRAFNSGMVPVVNYEGLELSYFGLQDNGEVCAFGCVILGDSMVPVIIMLTVDYAGDVLTKDVTVLTEEAVSGLRNRIRAIETELTQTNEALSKLPTDVQINGTSILDENKVANIPNATTSSYGLVKPKPTSFWINNNGELILNEASDGAIDLRSSERPICTSRLDYAVKQAMCDGKGAEWTDEEKASARARIGVGGKFELIEEITADGVSITERTAEPNGTPYNFTDVFVEINAEEGTSSQDVKVYAYFSDNSYIVATLINGIMTTKRNSCAHIHDIGGIYQAIGRYSSGGAIVVSNDVVFSYLVTNLKINKIRVNVALPVGSMIKIYGIRA